MSNIANIQTTATAMQPFHGSLNTAMGLYLDKWNGGVIDFGPTKGERHTVTKTRTLRYRFHAHFHPYVRELAKRLIEKSVTGLQAADTDYVQNSDGSFQSLPASFQAALPNDLALSIPKPGEPTQIENITLAGGVTVTLPDNIKIKLADGAEATLPGSVIARETERGTRVVRNDKKTADLDRGAVVTLLAAAQVTLPEAVVVKDGDGKLRRLAEPVITNVLGGTEVKLLGAKPRPALFREIFSDKNHTPSELVQRPYPVRDVDFTSSGAYSVYNWELFYHIPLAVAIQLSKNQRYEEAQRWFHYIFDPTDDSDGPTPDRFWKVKPFQYTEVKQIEEILVNLSSGMDSPLRQNTLNSIAAWKDAPFLRTWSRVIVKQLTCSRPSWPISIT